MTNEARQPHRLVDVSTLLIGTLDMLREFAGPDGYVSVTASWSVPGSPHLHSLTYSSGHTDDDAAPVVES